MGAAEQIQEVVGLNPSIKVDGDKVIVEYPKEAYLDMAKEAGITEKQIKEFKKFDDGFAKQLVVATGDALVDGYKQYKDATSHSMKYSTPLNTIEIYGKKLEHSVLSNTDNIGLRVNIKRDAHGLKATIAAKKKEIFGIINPGK